MKSTLCSIILVGALAITGCGKSYKTVVDDDPIGKGAPVEIDDHQDAGKVTRVFVDDAGHRIAQFTVNRSSEGLIREGIVHIRNGSVLQLRTDLATGPVLAGGSLIPSETNLGFAVKKLGSSRRALVTLAAAGAVICLCVVFAWRFARGLISLLLAVVLAAVTAYAANPFVLPIAQKIQQQVQSSSAPASLGQNAGTVSGGWADKLKAVERDFTNFLCTSPDAPRLVALLITFGVTFPIFAWLFRKITAPRMVCPLLILFAFPNVLTAAPEQTGVYYSRQFLTDEQSFCSRSLSEVDRNLDDATRLLDADLPGAPEDLVRALFISDLVEIRLEGEPDRIARLKWSFGYVRAQERQEFNAVYAELSQRLQTEEMRAATLSQRCNAATTAVRVLRIFQASEDHFRSLARAGLSDPQAVLDECSRKLTQEAQATNAQPKVEDGGKTAAELARVQRQQAELQAQMADFRRSQQLKPPTLAPNPPRTIFVTNEIVRTIEKRVPTPVFLTNMERVFSERTNFFVMVTNPPQVPATTVVPGVIVAATTKSTNLAVLISPTLTPAAATSGNTLASTNATTPVTSSTVSASKSRLPLAFALVGACVVVVVVLAGFAWLAALRGRLYSLSFATEAGETRTEELAALEDVLLLLGSSITRDHASVADPSSPRIAIGWRGPVLRSGTCGSVAVNDAPVQRSRHLLAGDRIAITDNKSQTSQLTLLACEPVELEVAGETFTSQL